jgi:hypothetical protein
MQRMASLRKIVPELFVHEYVLYRLTNPAAKLLQFGGGFGPGAALGLIDLSTAPSSADVFVDKKPMGVKSPTLLIVVPGSRKVKATQPPVVRKNLVRAIMMHIFPANIHDVNRLKSHRS